jgi:hypothetical protein
MDSIGPISAFAIAVINTSNKGWFIIGELLCYMCTNTATPVQQLVPTVTGQPTAHIGDTFSLNRDAPCETCRFVRDKPFPALSPNTGELDIFKDLFSKYCRQSQSQQVAQGS